MCDKQAATSPVTAGSPKKRTCLRRSMVCASFVMLRAAPLTFNYDVFWTAWASAVSAKGYNACARWSTLTKVAWAIFSVAQWTSEQLCEAACAVSRLGLRSTTLGS